MKAYVALYLCVSWWMLVSFPSSITAVVVDPGQSSKGSGVLGPRKDKPLPPALPSPQVQPPAKGWEEPASGPGVGVGGNSAAGRRQNIDTSSPNSNNNNNNHNSNSNSNNFSYNNRSYNGPANQDRYYVPSNCTRCRMHEAAINLTKEAIKQQILSKLGMQRAPNITGKVLPKIPTLSHLLEVHGMQSDMASSFQPGPEFDESEDDYHSKTQLLMTMAREPPRLWRFPPELNVQYFSLSSSGSASIDYVDHAKLWVYVKGPKTPDPDHHYNVIVHHVIRSSEGTGPLLSHFLTKTVAVEGKGKWVYLDVEKLVVDWLQYPNRNFGIVIQAFDRKGRNLVNTDLSLANGALIPYIEIHTTEERKRRRKRMIGLNCEENSNEVRCCRYPLTVDFEEFGWDWIIAPKKYEANYCSGECPFVFLQKYPHTHLVQQANPSGSAGPCCAPRKMSSISMLYFDDNNNIIYGLLPGMVVDRCGCS